MFNANTQANEVDLITDPAQITPNLAIVSGPYNSQVNALENCPFGPPPPPSPPPPSPPPVLPEGDVTPVIQPQSPLPPITPTGFILWPDWSDPSICGLVRNQLNNAMTFDAFAFSKDLGLYSADSQGALQPTTPAWLQPLNLVVVPKSLLPPKQIIAAILQYNLGALGSGLVQKVQALFTDPKTGDVTIGFGDIFAGVLRIQLDSLGNLLQSSAEVGLVIDAAQVYYRGMISLLSLAQTYLRADLGDYIQRLEYARASLRPVTLPGQGEANQCFYQGTITAAVWECWTRANDNIVNAQTQVLLAGRQKPGSQEVLAAFYRGYLSFSDAQKRLRELGIIDDSDLMLTTQLSIELPSTLEGIRFATFDILNNDLAEKYQLDTSREILTQQPYGQWIQSGGYDSNALTAIWRSHWLTPGLGEMVTALRRLRPGRVGENLVVTPSDLAYFQAQNQIHPWWRERLQALNYLPLGRREATQAFQFGVIDDQTALNALQDTGYDSGTAQAVLQSLQSRQKQHFRSSPWLRYIREGGMGRTEALLRLEVDGCPNQLAVLLINEALAEYQASVRLDVIKNVRRYYTTHALGAIDAQGILARLGLDPDQVQLLIQAWEVERLAHPREGNAGQITTWLDNGLISTDEAATRLQLMGYTPADTTRIIARAQQLFSARQAARASKAAAEKVRSEAQAARTAGKLERQQQAAEKARQAKADRLARNREAQARSRLITIRMFATRSSIDSASAERQLEGLASQIKGQYSLSDREAWDVLKTAVHTIPKKGDFDFGSLVNQAAQAEQHVLSGMGSGGNGTGG
jgi:hypothetical protein